SLLMAGRAPHLWAAVSSWVPITDCAAWYEECVRSGRRYAGELVAVCGGRPGESPVIDREYRRRSPLTWLDRARGLPVSINAGIRDGHDGSVPISHAFHGFNRLAEKEDQVEEAIIAAFTKEAAVPAAVQHPVTPDSNFGRKQPLWQRSSGKVELTIFDGDHEMVPEALFAFLEDKRRIPSSGSKKSPPELNRGGGKRDSLLFNHLLTECDRLDARRKDRLTEAVKEKETLKEHIELLNESYRELLGPFPEKTPLNPVVTNRMAGDGYSLETVVYESLPRHRVTANLYLPAEGNGPWPGILFACGHSANGKAYEAYQRACALFARNGFVVLNYDPISQGERTQLARAPRFGTTTHTLLNVGSRLVGRSVVWYQAWDGIRSIDYLLSRPEVDASKAIGMTGTSGGGTQTSFLMGLDDRIGPAAPSCYIMERTTKFRSAQGIADGCQHLPGEGAMGIDHIDYLIMRAPKPTLILAATNDFFDIRATRRAAEEGKQVFESLGLTDRQVLFVASSEHGMHVDHREEAVRWMRQWLMSEGAPIVEPSFDVFPEEKVLVTKKGQVGEEYAGEQSVADLNLTRATELAESRAEFARQPLETRRMTVRQLLGLPPQDELPPVHWRYEGRTESGLRRLVFQRGTGGMPVPAWLALPARATGKAVLMVSDRGKEADRELIEQRIEEGAIVLAMDVRGYGETRDKGSLSKYYNREHRTANIALHIGRSLMGQRVEDLFAGIDFLSARADVTEVEISARGNLAPVAWHAAFLDDQVKKVDARDSIRSWITDVVARPLKRDQVGLVVPGVLRHYDLPDLIRRP
ncbi:MAG: hypothetical protein AAF514_18365, partial [Verrucomicrobiota bacterium]